MLQYTITGAENSINVLFAWVLTKTMSINALDKNIPTDCKWTFKNWPSANPFSTCLEIILVNVTTQDPRVYT